ncbi:MAG: hypothetical protein M1827_002922 [Pycnora praestabilis]|nr:MAG: hypothetical protein M1827_002922 [Pycnora praestabilis]
MSLCGEPPPLVFIFFAFEELPLPLPAGWTTHHDNEIRNIENDALYLAPYMTERYGFNPPITVDFIMARRMRLPPEHPLPPHYRPTLNRLRGLGYGPGYGPSVSALRETIPEPIDGSLHDLARNVSILVNAAHTDPERAAAALARAGFEDFFELVGPALRILTAPNPTTRAARAVSGPPPLTPFEAWNREREVRERHAANRATLERRSATMDSLPDRLPEHLRPAARMRDPRMGGMEITNVPPFRAARIRDAPMTGLAEHTSPPLSGLAARVSNMLAMGGHTSASPFGQTDLEWDLDFSAQATRDAARQVRQEAADVDIVRESLGNLESAPFESSHLEENGASRLGWDEIPVGPLQTRHRAFSEVTEPMTEEETQAALALSRESNARDGAAQRQWVLDENEREAEALRRREENRREHNQGRQN